MSGEARSPTHGNGMRETAHSDLHVGCRDYTDEEIRSFVRDLESLPSGELTVSLLVGCGERAVPALREFLLYGEPRGVFQPRQRAVEALGELGAKDVLIEYLSEKREISNAVVRFGEEAVASTAARELARWPTRELAPEREDVAGALAGIRLRAALAMLAGFREDRVAAGRPPAGRNGGRVDGEREREADA